MIPRFLATIAVAWLLAWRCVAGEAATAVATISAGTVTAITVTFAGSGYTHEPAVSLSGGGGSGATAKAILSGDTVSLVVVLTSGSGYTTPPTVTIEAPPETLGLEVELVPRELVPKLTARGPVGSVARVEWSESMGGPWTVWTNVTLGVGGNVVVDLTPGAVSRFYRALGDPTPVGPEGFVWIEPGSFLMGSPTTEKGRTPDEREHTVTLTQGFWLSDHEVTQAEYQSLMGDNPSHFREGSLPVENVSWEHAVSYCQKLTERERAAGRITARQAYRLPTEAEWEYAARAGTTGTRYGEADAIAWHVGNSGGQTRPVKQKQPNEWGLYDMMGNVWEWCGDWYGVHPNGAVTDPMGPTSGTFRVIRGSGWDFSPEDARSAERYGVTPGFRNINLGFRHALSSVP